jgi:hypothetical protein
MLSFVSGRYNFIFDFYLILFLFYNIRRTINQLIEYLLMTKKTFMKNNLFIFQNRPWEWDGELPEAACTILHQHVIQGDLTELQVTI